MYLYKIVNKQILSYWGNRANYLVEISETGLEIINSTTIFTYVPIPTDSRKRIIPYNCFIYHNDRLFAGKIKAEFIDEDTGTIHLKLTSRILDVF